MTTNAERYAERHRQFCRRAEEEFANQRLKDPRFTLPRAVSAIAKSVHHAIARRDGIAAVLASQCAHLAMKGELYG